MLTYSYCGSPPSEDDEELLARLRYEAYLELEREESEIKHHVVPLTKSEEDREVRFLEILMGKVDLAEHSAGSNSALKEMMDYMARSLVSSEEKRAIRESIANESIEESVKKLRTERFHNLFSPRFANPITHGTPDTAFETVAEAKTDPRIARLMNIACCGTDEEKEGLLAAIENNYLATSDALRQEDPPWSANTSPLMGIPLILAELDEQGEQLGNLLALTREYIDGEYAELTGSFENPILAGAGSGTHYSNVLGSSIETVLINLHKHQLDNGMPIPQPIQEYMAMREIFQGWVEEGWHYEDFMSSIPLFKDRPADTLEYMLIDLYEAGLPGVTFDDYSVVLPTWFTPSSAAWLLIGIGARSYEALEGLQ